MGLENRGELLVYLAVLGLLAGLLLNRVLGNVNNYEGLLLLVPALVAYIAHEGDRQEVPLPRELNARYLAIHFLIFDFQDQLFLKIIIEVIFVEIALGDLNIVEMKSPGLEAYDHQRTIRVELHASRPLVQVIGQEHLIYFVIHDLEHVIVSTAHQDRVAWVQAYVDLPVPVDFNLLDLILFRLVKLLYYLIINISLLDFLLPQAFYVDPIL